MSELAGYGDDHGKEYDFSGNFLNTIMGVRETTLYKIEGEKETALMGSGVRAAKGVPHINGAVRHPLSGGDEGGGADL